MGMMVQAAQYKDNGIRYPVNIREVDNPFNSAWETKDGRYVQTCMPDYNTYYKRFMSAIGRTDLVDCEKVFPNSKFAKAGIGYEVYDIVMETMKTMTIAECSEKLKAADVPFSVAQSWEEILEDKQAWANECFYSMKYENGNVRTLVRPPVNFS